jgi:hypothetical protein
MPLRYGAAAAKKTACERDSIGAGVTKPEIHVKRSIRVALCSALILLPAIGQTEDLRFSVKPTTKELKSLAKSSRYIARKIEEGKPVTVSVCETTVCDVKVKVENIDSSASPLKCKVETDPDILIVFLPDTKLVWNIDYTGNGTDRVRFHPNVKKFNMYGARLWPLLDSDFRADRQKYDSSTPPSIHYDKFKWTDINAPRGNSYKRGFRYDFQLQYNKTGSNVDSDYRDCEIIDPVIFNYG